MTSGVQSAVAQGKNDGLDLTSHKRGKRAFGWAAMACPDGSLLGRRGRRRAGPAEAKWPLLFPGLLNLFFYFHSLHSILLQVPMCIYMSANYVYTLRG
jgi:hypothetical protein